LYLTPEGRGAVVTHNLYQDHELEKVRREHASALGDVEAHSEPLHTREVPSARAPQSNLPAVALVHPATTTPPAVRKAQGEMDSLMSEIERLREEFASTRAELDALRTQTASAIDQVREQLEELNQQLGNL
jgi:hypothetical protein